MTPGRIAILGGGTAGWMAAAHLSRHLPGAELHHIWDPSIPSIGVGEGTLPAFPPWIHEVTGLDFDELQRRCRATYKLGVRFENWGRRQDLFFHNFTAGSFAYHLSARDLPTVLTDVSRARRVHRRIAEIDSNGRRVALTFEEGDSLEVDFAVDALGFPTRLSDKVHLTLPGIPTDTATLRQGPAGTHEGGTRAIARPYGWIFAIPLTSHISYGYLSSSTFSDPDAVRSDFDAYFHEEGLRPSDRERQLRFPSFRRRSFFDGALFHVGNTASFLEPLEATAIGLILLQLEVMTWWLRDELVGIRGEERWRPEVLEKIDGRIGDAIDSVGLFVAWHYAAGSAFDTPFWRNARQGFHGARNRHRDRPAGKSFRRLSRAAAGIPAELLPHVRDPRIYAEKLAPLTGPSPPLGGFDEISFAQIGEGLGLL